jgi:O-antigen/teichoic acid export membrane protein
MAGPSVSQVRKSILFSAADKYASQALMIVTTAIMARILTPAETGLYVIASSVTLLANSFRDFGVGVYIVQQKEIGRGILRSAFTLTFVLSLVMGSAVCLGAGLLSSFYRSPGLQHLLFVAALGFLVVPFSSPILALLQRDLAFKTLAWINIAAALAGCIITVGFGLWGMGPVSYVWGSVGTSVVICGLALSARPEFWIFRPSFARMRPLLSFGAVSSLITISNIAYDLLPKFAFGKILGFGAVGLYARALTVCQLPDRFVISALQPVVLPAFAAQARSGDSLKAGYLHGLSLMTAVQWPILVMLSLLAEPVVSILLGPQWGAVPPLVRIMALANMALAPAVLTFPVLVAAGRIGDALWASLISLPPSFLIVTGAAFLGLEAVAASLLLVAPLQMFVAYLFIRRAIDISWADLARTARSSAGLLLGTALVPVIVVATSSSGFSLGWLQTAMALAGGASGWAAALILVDHPLKREIGGIWLSLSGREWKGKTATS